MPQHARTDDNTLPMEVVRPAGRRPDRRPSAFLPGLHAFRAIATVLVIGQHATWILAWPPDSVTRRVLSDVLDNSTVLFVFLSGFLFAHLAGRHSYLELLRRRATTVVLPYLLVVLPAAVLAVVSKRAGGPFTDIAGDPVIVRLGWFLLHGATMVNIALWFVPMIALYYLLSPVLGLFLRVPQLFWLLVLLVPLAVLAHRPAIVPHADVRQMAAYYLPVYLLGMCASHHRARLEPLARFWWVLVIGYAAGLLTEIVAATYHGNYEGRHLFSQEHGLIDWVLVQKLVLCAVLLAVTHRFAHRLTWLRYLGFASFSVYLLHCYLVDALKLLVDRLDLGGTLLAWAVTTASALGGALLLVRVVRRVLGPYSLYVIGSADEKQLAGGRGRPPGRSARIGA